MLVEVLALLWCAFSAFPVCRMVEQRPYRAISVGMEEREVVRRVGKAHWELSVPEPGGNWVAGEARPGERRVLMYRMPRYQGRALVWLDKRGRVTRVVWKES